MKLILTVTSEQSAVLGADAEKVFTEVGGGIGRTWDNYWVLPDPERFISGHHAYISCESECFYLKDTSSNGVYVNDSDQPIGNGNAVGIQDGDSIHIGEYTMSAKIDMPNIDDTSEFMALDDWDQPPGPAMGALDPSFDANPISSEGSVDPLELMNNPAPVQEQPSAGPAGIVDGLAPPPGAGADDPFGSVADEAHPGAISDHTAGIDAFFKPPGTSKDDNMPETPSGIPENWDATGYIKMPSIPDDFAPAATPTAGPEDIPANPFDTPPPQTPQQAGQNAQSAEQTPPTAPISAPTAAMDPAAQSMLGAGAAKSQAAPPSATVGSPPHAAAQQAAIPPIPGAASPGIELTPAQKQALCQQMNLDPSLLTPELINEWLSVMPVVVQGVISLLMARGEIKNEFRISQTMLQPVENNPLKFSVNVEDVVHNLFINRRPGFLDPKQSFEQALGDINTHQVALLSGIKAGMQSLLKRFDPENLEEDFNRGLKRGALLSRMNTSKYWELYKEMFDDIKCDTDDDFRELFGDTFVRAYDEQISILTRKK